MSGTQVHTIVHGLAQIAGCCSTQEQKDTYISCSAMGWCSSHRSGCGGAQLSTTALLTGSLQRLCLGRSHDTALNMLDTQSLVL